MQKHSVNVDGLDNITIDVLQFTIETALGPSRCHSVNAVHQVEERNDLDYHERHEQCCGEVLLQVQPLDLLQQLLLKLWYVTRILSATIPRRKLLQTSLSLEPPVFAFDPLEGVSLSLN